MLLFFSCRVLLRLVTEDLNQGRIYLKDFATHPGPVDSICGIVNQAAIARLAFAQGIHGAPLCVAQEFFFLSAVDGHRQPGHLVFENVVGDAQLDAFDGHAIPQRAGDENQRQIEAQLLDLRQGVGARPTRQAIVGEHDIKGLLAQLGREFFRRGCGLDLQVEARALELL